jgi:hypothetical protein
VITERLDCAVNGEKMSTLTGLGKSGSWQVDIDNEFGQSYTFSVTFSHPSCYLRWSLTNLHVIRELVEDLVNPTESKGGYQFQNSGAELLIAANEDRLKFRMNKQRNVEDSSFECLMEISFPSQELNHFTIALSDALEDSMS